jgi:hypothetical protein
MSILLIIKSKKVKFRQWEELLCVCYIKQFKNWQNEEFVTKNKISGID